jgi:beta-glucosidase
MKSRIKYVFPLMLLLLFFFHTGHVGAQVHIQPPEVKKKVENLLSQMTLEEKIGQMTQVAIQAISKPGLEGELHEIDPVKLRKAVKEYKVGSILNIMGSAFSVERWHEVIQAIQDTALKETRLKIPVLYGLDSVHGANYIKGTVIFPQSIGMAATFNEELSKKEGEITAYETRAAGVPWNFNPVLGLGRLPTWSRLWETYGEDPYLASVLGKAYVKGQEGENNAQKIEKDRVATCIKHYLGYSFPLSGKDRTPAWIPERMLREYFLPPFYHGVLAGSHTLMVNSTEINGVPVHASPFYLKTLLRDEMGFEGFVVSDWMDIKNLHTRSRVASTQKEAVKISVMAGTDMSMVPFDFSFYKHLLELVKEGSVPVSRIDEAVRRILMVKFKLGLFEDSYPDKQMAKKVGCKAFTDVALEAARESVTLLKNKNGVLPLRKGKRILVTGPNADRLSVLNSGWTYTWQGDDEKQYPQEKDTILEGIVKKFGKDKVTYVPGCTFDKEVDIEAAVKKAKEVDFIIACMGEDAYCETPGNIDDLSLPEVQLRLVSRLHETGKPVILVLTEGRPRLIRKIVDKVSGILMAYLPGNEGGRAIADILAGDVNPSGKLPVTYPKYPNDLVCYDYKYSENTEPNKFDPEFPFGFGLSYTEFQYRDLTLGKKVMKIDENLKVSVTVKNKGKLTGKEAVLLYVGDLYASITPHVKRLKRFKKIELAPGEEKVVTFTLTKDDLSFIGLDMKPTVEPGDFKVMVGSLNATFNLKN